MLFWATAAFTALLTICAALQRPAWPAEIFLSLSPQLAIAAGLTGAIFFGLGRVGPSIGVLACCIVFVFTAQGALSFAPKAHKASSDVTLIWANVFGQSDSLDRVLKSALKENTDLVLIAEKPRSLTRIYLEKTAPDYTYVEGSIDDSGAAITLLSKIPVSSYSIIEVAGRKSISFDVAVRGEKISIVAVHPTIPSTPSKMRQREDHLVKSADVLSNRPMRILLGDLNTVPWSPSFKTMAERASVRRLSPTAPSTWISKLPGVGLPLDHVLASANLDGEVRVGAPIGSDHFPLHVSLTLTSGLNDASSDHRDGDKRNVLP